MPLIFGLLCKCNASRGKNKLRNYTEEHLNSEPTGRAFETGLRPYRDYNAICSGTHFEYEGASCTPGPEERLCGSDRSEYRGRNIN